MSEQPSALIIPFPRGRRANPEIADAKGRLAVSLATLSEALEEQRNSVEAWRSAMRDLSNSMKGLSANLEQFTIDPSPPKD
ncbi:MAG: hypothetical protein WDN49_15105 [Acetobacteraceae bacterium]